MSIQEGPLASETRITKHAPNDYQASGALLAVRLALGLPLLYHGSAILFGSFGGPGLHGFATFTHLPVFVAALVGIAEFVGSLAILSGILARLGALCTAVVMTGAILIVHLHHGYEVSAGGSEYALTLLLLSIALIISGAGYYTVVHLFPERDQL